MIQGPASFKWRDGHELMPVQRGGAEWNRGVVEPSTWPDSRPIESPRPPQSAPQADALGPFRNATPAWISVVLPACNERGLLQRTVEQFRATLPPHSEIIVVDNGSTDGCADFLADSDRHPADGQARLIDPGRGPAGVALWLRRYPQALGVVGARNSGLECARGEVVVFSGANADVPADWFTARV